MIKRIPVNIESYTAEQLEQLTLLKSRVLQTVFMGSSKSVVNQFKKKYPNEEVVYKNPTKNDIIFNENLSKIIVKVLNDENTALFLDRHFQKVSGENYGPGVHNYYGYIAQTVLKRFSLYMNLKFDYAFHASTPHSIEWWIGGLINEYMGKPNLNPGIGPIPWRRHLFDSFRRNRNICAINDDKLTRIDEDKKNVDLWIRKVQSDYSSAIPDYEKKRLDENKGKYFNIFNDIKKFWYKPGYILNKYRCYKTYKELSVQVKDTGYVTLFLHYQPERTSLPEGYGFTNQYIAVLALRAALPDNVSIVVKEHPSTFTNFCSPKHRHPNFYEELKKVPNVILAKIEQTPFELIDNSIATVTLTGSVGVESLLRGKPAVYLGLPLVKDSYGAHAYTDMAGLRSFFSKCIEGFEKEKIVKQTKRYIFDSMKNSIPMKNDAGNVENREEEQKRVKYELLYALLKGDVVV